jgi:parallel beta-helix repeat protein
VSPYITAAGAATTLADAIAVAATGDSILVDSTTVNLPSLSINKGVTLFGGWTNDFTARDVTNTPTTLNLSANITMLASSGTSGIDGFVIQGGGGTFESQPISGNYGGGIKVLLGSARIANCRIRNCDANLGVGFGGGGAIFVKGAVADISNNWIHTNTATRGGGIYLYNSTGSTLTNNLIENNSVTVSNGNDPYGAGIVIQQCTNTVLVDNVLQNNTGAVLGGGAWVTNSSNTAWTGGTVAHHAASNTAGGIYFSSSAATLDSVTVTGNSAALFGGGIWSNANLNVNQCAFTRNHAVLGGGLNIVGGISELRHNLWVLNSSSSAGAALSITAATSASIIGNTLDRNSANAGAGGMLLSNSTFVVTNNIVANSGGNGIACANATTTLSYNLVWNSSQADYDGCVAGPGSLDAAPAFADTANGDYHLGLHSAALDAADPAPQWNDPDGSRGDLGWYGSHPFLMQQPEFPKNVMQEESGNHVLLSWSPNPELNVDFYAIYCDSISGFLPGPDTFVETSSDSLFNTGAAAADTFYYRIVAVNTAGHASGYSDEIAADPTTTSTSGQPPSVTTLSQNFPNPFNPLTTIGFDLAQAGHVRLSVYDPRGRLVRLLLDAMLPADRHRTVWDGRDNKGARVSSGIYYSRLETADGVFHRKMALLK